MSKRLLYTKCSCVEPVFTRLKRSPWMRLFPSRRLYYCHICEQRIFCDKIEAESYLAQPPRGGFPSPR